MKFRIGVTLATALLMCLVAVAQAQQPGGRGGFGGGFGGFGGGFGGGQSLLGLLRIEEVQKELGLTEEQVAAIQKLQEELRPMRGGERGQRGPRGEGQRGEGRRGGNRPDPNSETRAIPGEQYFVQQPGQPGQRGGRGQFTPEQLEEFRAQAAERAKVEKEKLAAILLPDQMKRLNEIRIQQMGVAALTDEEISKQLEITDEQKAKFTKADEDNRAAMQELFQSGDREGMREKMGELQTKRTEAYMAVLTDAQKTKFTELKGKEFKMPENAFGGFGGRGGQRGGERGGQRGGQRGNNNE